MRDETLRLFKHVAKARVMFCDPVGAKAHICAECLGIVCGAPEGRSNCSGPTREMGRVWEVSTVQASSKRMHNGLPSNQNSSRVGGR